MATLATLSLLWLLCLRERMGASPGADAAAEKDVFDCAGAVAMVRGGRATIILYRYTGNRQAERESVNSDKFLAETETIETTSVGTRSESLPIDAAPPPKAVHTCVYGLSLPLWCITL